MTKGKGIFSKKNSVTYKLVPVETGPSQFEDDAPRYNFVPVPKKGGRKLPPNPFEAPFQAAVPKEPVTVERIFPFSGPRPDWDPDVVAALDDDFDFENPNNQLEDDFITQATGVKLKGDDEPSSDEEDDENDQDNMDEDGSLEYSSEFSDDDDEISPSLQRGKAKSTNYSMTSAVTNCTENIKILNERFEKLLDAYDDDQIGALDFEDIEGYLQPNCERIEEMMTSEMNQVKLFPIEECDEGVKEHILRFAEEDKPEVVVVVTTEKPAIEFDCESILSTYSNIYNHPTLIKADFKRRPRLTKGLLKKLEKETEDSDEDNQSVTTASFTRPKDETPEQRRERKKVIKEIRRENRAVKKENKIAFKREKQLQDIEALNIRRNNGIKML